MGFGAARTFEVRDRQLVAAPLERVFALSTSIEVVQRTLGFMPVSGVTHGHVTAGSEVLWRGWMFGLPQFHLTRITDFAAPHTTASGDRAAYFQDTQARGRFAFFQHGHHMLSDGTHRTLLQDEIRFALPFGIAGALVARFVMVPFMVRILRSRMRLLDQLATTGEGDPFAGRD